VPDNQPLSILLKTNATAETQRRRDSRREEIDLLKRKESLEKGS
jgi:hypothetical protein